MFYYQHENMKVYKNNNNLQVQNLKYVFCPSLFSVVFIYYFFLSFFLSVFLSVFFLLSFFIFYFILLYSIILFNPILSYSILL